MTPELIIRQLISLAVLIAITGAPAFAQDSPGPAVACRAALGSRQSIVAAIATRMARASELTDTQQKAQHLRQLQIEIIALQKTHGLSIVGEIERQASALQAQIVKPTSQEREKTRVEESELLLKWQRMAPLLPNFKGLIAGARDQMIYYEDKSLKIQDLNDPSRATREIKIDTSVEEHFILELTPNAQAAKLYRKTPGKVAISNLYHIDLLTNAVTKLPPVSSSIFESATMFADGSLFLQPKNKPHAFLSPPHDLVELPSLANWGELDAMSFLSTSRYMLLRSVADNYKIFDRSRMELIDVQKSPMNVLESFNYDPVSDRILAIQKQTTPYASYGGGQLVEIHPGTGKTEPRNVGVEKVFTTTISGDHSRLFIEHDRNGERRTLRILNLSTSQLNSIEGIPADSEVEVYRVQSNGPLALVKGSTIDRKGVWYIVDTHTVSAVEIPRLHGKVLADAQFSSDGNKLWLNIVGDPKLYELK